MKRKLLLIIGLLVLAGPAAYARGPKEKLATAVFEDPTNATSIFAVPVSTWTSVKLYTPAQFSQGKDERSVIIQNTSPQRYLHITTWVVSELVILNSTVSTTPSFIVQPSTMPNSFLRLPPGTTYYGRFEQNGTFTIGTPAVGTTSETIRGMVHRWDGSQQQ